MLKPCGVSRADKTKNRWAEPFVEWLRFRGYFEGSAGWFTSGDLRLFCPIPSDISYTRFAAAAASFRDLRLGGTAAKMDCRAVLGLARLIIEGGIQHRSPARAIGGVSVTHYKDMGQAHTVMTTEQLALPDWFELRTSEDAQFWLRTLEEHDTIIRRLTDSHSEEFALLQQYRRTFQMRRKESIAEFATFLQSYGMLLFNRRARDHWSLPQLTVAGVTAILEHDGDLRPMLQDPGTVAVSAAIRSSTVGAQAARRQGRVDHRDIRYGLLSDIQRAEIFGRQRFLEQIFAFIAAFNREGARRRAAGLKARVIEIGELNAFAATVERLPANAPAGAVVCGLATCFPATAAVEAEPSLAGVASA
jgi:hypothetical protein